MPRPSLKAEKKETILAAYEQCAARYGVEGATLQRVADAAGMARPLLRHYVGNQEDLLRACSKRLVERSAKELEQVGQIETPEMLIEMLFMTGENDKAEIAIAWALILAAPDYDFVRSDMSRWFASFHRAFVETLKRLYPGADQSGLDAVAVGLIAICSNYHTMKDLADESFLSQSYQSAALLLAQLKNQRKYHESLSY